MNNNPTPPENYTLDHGQISIFLAGTVSTDKATDWRTRLTKDLSYDTRIVIINPVREDWDSSWKEDPTSGTKFREQVEWELNSLETADILVFYFEDDSTSPVTMLEFGLHARDHRNVFVRCSKKFYKYGNIKIICDKYGIPCHSTYDELVAGIYHQS